MKLQDVKVGDTVIGHSRGICHSRSVEVVRRLTKTLIITGLGRYNRTTGKRLGVGDYSSDRGYIEPATPEQVAEVRKSIRRLKMIDQIKHLDWRKVADDKLEAIFKILT